MEHTWFLENSEHADRRHKVECVLFQMKLYTLIAVV